jgi:hypothetical protein
MRCLADRAVRCAHRRVIFRLSMHMGGQRESVLVWDEEDNFNVDEESDRLVLQGPVTLTGEDRGLDRTVTSPIRPSVPVTVAVEQQRSAVLQPYHTLRD